MRFSFFILLLCCGLIVSCNSADPIFPREETLTMELMPLQGITNPVRVEVIHPFLILQNWKRTDSLFHIYDLTDYKLKSVFGVTGPGPDDFLVPELYRTQLPDIFIGDKNSIYRFEINNQGLSVFKDVRKISHFSGAANAAFINDSLYVVDPLYYEPSIYLLKLQDELPRKKRQYRDPAIRDYFVDPDRADVYANENRIVLCYQYKKQLDFMDIDLNLIKRVKFKFDRTRNFSNPHDYKYSYTTGYFGKRYFYALFVGTTGSECIDLSFRKAVLEVFDLDGNPVISYLLDGLLPFSFAVDEETFTFYGYRSDGEPDEDCLLMYQLKGLS